MDVADLVDVVVSGLTHDAEAALARLEPLEVDGTQTVLAATTFLRVLACRFDEALDAALALTQRDEPLVPLAKAATELAVAVCAGAVTTGHDEATDLCDIDALLDLTGMLEVEAAMSSGLISVAERIAGGIVDSRGVETPTGVWSALALARAWCFEGRFVEADQLVGRVMAAESLGDWPQMHRLACGVRIFVDGHRGRSEVVRTGLDDLRVRCPGHSEPDYIRAGALVLAAFGATAIGLLPEAADLVLRGGGGEHLPYLQIVDRLYGYEILVEDAVSRGDIAAAHDWSEHAVALPIAGHQMASAALGRIRARVSVAGSDPEAGMRESADSGALAALVGGDLEVIRARVLESAARAATGDRVRGIEELEDVARRAAAVGAEAVKGWAERELQGLGRRLRNVPGHGWDTLTTTQQSIARMAAAGLRNREIAATLWVSEKTVEGHLGAVLGALGTTNRVGIGRELGTGVDPSFGPDLTRRQREVALLVAEGRSNLEISTALAISEKTVEKHVAGLFDRLGVRTRSAVAARVRGVGQHSTAH